MKNTVSYKITHIPVTYLKALVSNYQDALQAPMHPSTN